ncbi:Huntingtin-interacting protein 1-related protein [Larimichthys crocea]|uniref:Uncharacterized protein n=1 Tax=Larimichthys crocea TaxID=215358 RepID=A0ACD3Q948_LARCR|nr:Huntingtin-interacting protein 1-related protein [Larimichthys crocea]
MQDGNDGYKIEAEIEERPEIPPNLEVTDEVLERTAGIDINNVFQLTVEVFDYLDTELRLAETVIRQLNTSIAISTLTSGQCRLAPLIQVIQDSSHLYHFTVKLLFKLHASSLAKHVKPVVVMADEEEPEQQDDDDDDPEPLIEVSDVSTPSIQAQPQQLDIFDQTFGPPNGGFDDRDLQIESLKRDLELLRAELERVKAELEEQKFEMEKLRRELEEKLAEVMRIKATLQSSEKD